MAALPLPDGARRTHRLRSGHAPDGRGETAEGNQRTADGGGGREVILFGLAEGADVRAADLQVDPLSLRFQLRWQSECVPARVPLPGRHNIYTAPAAAAVALSQGYTL